VRRFALPTAFVIAMAVAITACERSEPSKPGAAGAVDARDFQGSWNATGQRYIIPLGAGRNGSIIHLRGSMLLAGEGRPGVGFRADVVALNDSVTGLVGRSVWTDEKGDQVFSELKGEGTASRNRITGTIFGGTGRYTGFTGTYEFAWEYVIESDDGSIQGRAVGLKGRVTRP
jgi:hypothetical protein